MLVQYTGEKKTEIQGDKIPGSKSPIINSRNWDSNLDFLGIDRYLLLNAVVLESK